MKKFVFMVAALSIFLFVFVQTAGNAEAKYSVKSYKNYSSPSLKSYKSPTYKSYSSPTRASGYLKSNGTYVQPYYKTTPNKTKIDNYSTKGNYNPFTGKTGYKKLW